MIFDPADFKPSAGHHRQVRIRGLAARLGQHAMNLSAMVGLVIEEVRHEQPARLRSLVPQARREIGKRAGPANPGRARPLIQVWSAHRRWLIVLWIEPRKAPRS